MENWLIRLYTIGLLGIATYGWLGLVTLWFYWRYRHASYPVPDLTADETELPFVTVQLPMFNERFVVERIVTAATKLQYPRNRFEIQIVDDSTDDTTDVAAELVRRFQAQGFDIKLLHRTNRSGYKAGALKAAVDQAKGEYLALFDADFSPEPDFLLQTVPHFMQQPRLGVIQVRWAHLNPDESSLTRAQAIAIDKHFTTEQTVRHRADLFPKFNGSGGIWRRACLEDAGGWQTDTVCEDLCLSTRAMLRGWQFRYLDHVTAPAELPSTILSYKSQQARWAKGSLQCLTKFFWSILTSPHHRLTARLYAVVAMGAHLSQRAFFAVAAAANSDDCARHQAVAAAVGVDNSRVDAPAAVCGGAVGALSQLAQAAAPFAQFDCDNDGLVGQSVAGDFGGYHRPNPPQKPRIHPYPQRQTHPRPLQNQA